MKAQVWMEKLMPRTGRAFALGVSLALAVLGLTIFGGWLLVRSLVRQQIAQRDAEALHVVWRETTPDFKLVGDHRGFGTAVLENMVGRSLGAKVERIVHADGLEWRFSIPAAGIEPGIASADAERPAA